MRHVAGKVRACALAAFVLTASAASGKDGGPEAGTTEDAGRSCTSSDDCSRPTVHCHPARHECVQCLSTRNCGGGLVCDVAASVCVSCATDADCPGDEPYCASGRCVQCRTEANCGSEGVVCSNGVCGSCGDGVCHRSEVIVDNTDFREVRGCPQDCASQCPTLTLELDEVRTVPLTRNLFDFSCGTTGTNDFTVAFTAPKEFVYKLKLRADVDTPAINISELSDCQAKSGSCALGDFQKYGYSLGMTAGQTMTLLIEATTTRALEVQIVEEGPLCTEDCGEPVPDSGRPTEEDTAECLASASRRGDDACDGVTCACTECPRAYDACGEAKGCGDVIQCMHDKGCIGVDCYTSGACRRVVDSQGGVSGPAFRTATALQACMLSHLCALPCREEDAEDAGATSPPDAGPLCTPGRRVACSCEGGASGTRRCNESGTSFAECVCSSPEVPEPASCDCNVGRRASSGGVALLLFGLIAGLAGRRGGRASRRHR